MPDLRRRAIALGIIFGAILALGTTAFAKETEEFHKTYPLAANGTFALGNINGTVKITGWDQNMVQVDAVKSADDPDYLRQMRIDVAASPNVVEVKTRYPEGYHSGHGGGVEYTISIPRGARIRKVELVNGKLVIEGVRAEINASIVNGSVTANGSAANLKLSSVNGPVSAQIAALGNLTDINSVNGPITLTIPSDSNAQFKASTVSGNIKTEFGIYVRHARYGPGASADAQIGQGGNRLELDTVNGGIHLQRAQDGKTVSKITQRDRGEEKAYY